jgi:hypothetical protein
VPSVAPLQQDAGARHHRARCERAVLEHVRFGQRLRVRQGNYYNDSLVFLVAMVYI